MDEATIEKIKYWSDKFDLPFEIVHAQIMIESGGDTWAVRYESHWRWFVTPSYWARRVNISSKTERVCQMMSFGIYQVMGAVARELGHEGDLTQLCDPDVGIRLGCKKMKQLMRRYDDDIKKALSAYNSGRPNSRRGNAYAEKVFTRKAELY